MPSGRLRTAWRRPPARRLGKSTRVSPPCGEAARERQERALWSTFALRAPVFALGAALRAHATLAGFQMFTDYHLFYHARPGRLEGLDIGVQRAVRDRLAQFRRQRQVVVQV